MLTKEIIKGSPSYSVTIDGVEIARSHRIFVPTNLFTVVIGGKWAGVTCPEEEAVEILRALDTEA